LLGQAQPKFTLGSVFDVPRIVLINLNAGAIGPNTASVVGSLLLNQLWQAIQRQTTKPAVQRRPVAVFVDGGRTSPPDWTSRTCWPVPGEPRCRSRWPTSTLTS
jgi:hypothetical protein